MRIYHRFECHNIYSHVVEAGFHTGTHWIRDMRTVLVNKLCKDFPERFQNQKTANKCLNWVDQGCRYREWTDLLSETSDLGYLLALPADVPHSACTKDQMTAAALRFKSLGIDKLVEDLELSELGNHISAKLREMTGKKRKYADGRLSSSALVSHQSRGLYMRIRRPEPELPQITAINAILGRGRIGPRSTGWPVDYAARINASWY
ncbi:hypothetical protein E5D57_000158 [Metarhizium anisopliae]|nr:hypothetical protein E5D57_000158 [Metarhizium anisopliae]